MAIVKRIGLTHAPSSAIDVMRGKLKENEVSLKFSDSQLVSSIVELFFNKYFDKEKKYFEDAFFDKKKALYQIMKESKTPEELEKSLEKLFKKNKK